MHSLIPYSSFRIRLIQGPQLGSFKEPSSRHALPVVADPSVIPFPGRFRRHGHSAIVVQDSTRGNSRVDGDSPFSSRAPAAERSFHSTYEEGPVV